MGRARHARRAGEARRVFARSRAGIVVAIAGTGLGLATAGCFDFQKDPPPGPSALPAARYATVRVQYRQPNGCANVASPCNSRVVFFGSWMRPGEELLLDGAPGHLWTGAAVDVPVNWPPMEAPHLVRIFDPYLTETDTGGVTASRLSVGGQVVTVFDQIGTPAESAYVYVDDVGVGHNPQ